MVRKKEDTEEYEPDSLKALLDCEAFHSVTYPATAKIVARQVARKVELNSTFGNGSCNLSHNDFGRRRVCYTAGNVSFNLFRHNVAKTLRDKLHETFHSATAL